MRIKILFLLILGGVLAIASGIGSYRYIWALEAELAAARETIRSFGTVVSVPVLSRDMARGSPLAAGDLTTVSLPLAVVPQNVLAEKPDLAKGEPLLVMSDIKAGQLLLTSDIAHAEKAADFGFILSKDARAFALAPKNLRDFRGRLRPGDIVDVFWTHSIGGGSTETRLVGSAMRILHVPASGVADATADETALDGKLILEGLARDAALMIAAEKDGTFHILPTSNKLDPGAAEVAVGPADLADLPLVVRAGAGEAAGAEDPVSIVSRIGLSPGGRTCSTVIVRAAVRNVVEVPC